jgi:hypothetical protein
MLHQPIAMQGVVKLLNITPSGERGLHVVLWQIGCNLTNNGPSHASWYAFWKRLGQ